MRTTKNSGARARTNHRIRLNIEEFEPRIVLSQFFTPFGTDGLAVADAAADAKGGAPAVGPAIKLNLVALHEFGHSLGLQHSDDPNSIMYAYYNANYDPAKLASDSATAILNQLYTDTDTTDGITNDSGPWKDSLDPHPRDGVVEITFSFMPNGTALDQGKKNTLFSTFNQLYGSEAPWQQIFVDDLNLWASASGGKLSFSGHSDSGLGFNYSGSAQNDSASGDIRIGTHRFDGAGKVLAHTYFPPPNGSTAAGDAHFDDSENWDGKKGGAANSTTGGGGTGSGNLTLSASANDSGTVFATVSSLPPLQGWPGMNTPDQIVSATLTQADAKNGSQVFVLVDHSATSQLRVKPISIVVQSGGGENAALPDNEEARRENTNQPAQNSDRGNSAAAAVVILPSANRDFSAREMAPAKCDAYFAAVGAREQNLELHPLPERHDPTLQAAITLAAFAIVQGDSPKKRRVVGQDSDPDTLIS